METTLHALRTKGCKITPQRRAVVAALHARAPFPTARDILDHIRQANPDVSLDTVYRNLTLLVGHGLVSQINLPGHGGSVFEIVAGRHHHHLVCLGCGRAECLDHCPVTAHDLARAEERGFAVVSHSLEYYGYCRTCRPA